MFIVIPFRQSGKGFLAFLKKVFVFVFVLETAKK